MKRFVIIALTMVLTSPVFAQSNLLNALKGAATEAVDKATGGALTSAAIVSTWNYSAPAVRLQGDSALMNVASAAASAPISTKLGEYFEKVGIKPGLFSITFTKEGDFIVPVKGKQVKGTYTFDAQTHQITFKVSKISVSAFAYLDGDSLQLLYPADNLVSFISAIGENIQGLSTVTAMLKNFKSANIGMAFRR